jgi:type VI secretion system protein ImpA
MTTETLNIEELLTPVSAEQPAGVDLRLDESPDALYYQLKDARNSARAIERNSFPGDENQEHLEKDHWKLILKQAPKALAQSKDLEIAAWLTEALIRQEGFAGLKQGFTLIHGLVQNFWDGLYPLPDEDGISTRVAVLVGLNGVNNTIGTLVAPINTAPLTSDGDYSSWSYMQALELDKTKDAAAKKKKMDAGAVPVDTIKAAVKPSQSQFYVDLDQDLQTIIEQFSQLTDQLETVCGDDTPPSSNIRKALEGAQKALHVIAKNILTPDEPVAMDETGSEEIAAGDTPAFGSNQAVDLNLTGNVKSRLEAFKHLQAIAEFFKRTEPHSPIGFTIERVVRWGDMSLPELLAELVPDPQAKDYYEKLVGILPPQDPHMGSMQHSHGMDPMMQDQYNNGMGGHDMNQGMGHDDYSSNGGYDNPLFR